MLRREIDNAGYPVEVGAVTPNFRVFTDGVYGEPITKATSPQQPVVYVLVSIMSGLFTYATSVEHMMLETDQAYADTVIPIIYICADQLQNVTEKILHGDKAASAIEKARTKWQRKYQAARKDKNDSPKHEVVYWDKLISHPDYARIRKFVDLILTSEESLDAEFIKQAFYDIDIPEDRLSELLLDIQGINIAPSIQRNAQEFARKNERQLLRKRKSDQKSDLIHKVNKIIHGESVVFEASSGSEDGDVKKKEVEEVTS
ncbi:MAG: hypothetical protein KBD03_04420, partial [Gammaproteobacteria bacterium]|nr:hypothetical protein [Gammaproteobacteria bacterium]